MPCFDQWFDSSATYCMPPPAAQGRAMENHPQDPDPDWQPL
jgi:hypothetical protein